MTTQAHHPDRAPPDDVGCALLGRVARGDQAALEDFYSGYQSSVYRFAHTQLGDAFAAAELLNDVMMEVWRNAARRPADVDPLTWVLMLAHRAVGRGASGTVAPPATAFSILHDLPARLRAALHLALVEDLPVARIASVLGRDEDDVRACLREATSHLRKQFAETPP